MTDEEKLKWLKSQYARASKKWAEAANVQSDMEELMTELERQIKAVTGRLGQD